MLKKVLALWLAACALAGSAPAFASVLYTTGTPLFNLGGYTIGSAQVLSASFVLTQDADVTGVVLPVWASPGSTPLTVTWRLGSSFFGSDLGTGTSNLSNTPAGTSANGSSAVYFSQFDLPSTQLAAGTYYLSIADGTATSNTFYWDYGASDDGTSMRFIGNRFALPINNLMFEILGGDSTGVPEPGTALLFGAALLGLALVRRRKQE